jgi:polysaccharide biosynthesis PFTS motif protein
MLCLPSAVDRFKDALKVMFWYSDNSRQIKGIDFRSDEEIDYSYLELHSIDIHCVWTESWATILRNHSHGEVIVIGPILFRNLAFCSRPSNKRSGLVKCLVFDVTPKQALSNSNNFYKEDNVISFMQDILESFESMEVQARIDLKPKRSYTKLDSRKYLEFLKENSDKFNLLSPIQDIPKLMEDYDLIVCIPYTSPAIIGKYLGVRTIFYSPTSDFILQEEYEKIPVIVGHQALLSELAGFES